MALVSNTELIIGKVCALLDRCAARDVWDVAHLPNALADALVGERFRWLLVVLLGTLAHPPEAYSEARLAARITLREVEIQLKPMLVSGLVVESERLVRSAWARIAQLLEATDVERAYFDALSRGEIDLGPLFVDDPAEAERLSRHPALFWKAHNARSFHARGGVTGDEVG